MPYPAQINPERILEKAREIVEAEGANNLSLQGLARALGVKAPSLYRYFPSKTDLLRELNLQTVRQLIEAMHQVADNGVAAEYRGAADDGGAARDGEAAKDGGAGKGGLDARRQMLVMAHTWRDFARAYPAAYALAFADPDPELRPDERLMEALAIPLQQIMAGISGEKDSLAALRGLWALLHGFVLLEQSGQFRRGGDLGAAFHQSVEAYLNGWLGESQRPERGTI